MSETRTLLAIGPDDLGPVLRYRALAFRLALAKAGVVLETTGWPKGWRARRRVLERAKKVGHAWVLSRLLRPADVRALRRRVRRLLFDFDDAVPFRDTAHGATPSPTRTRRFRTILRAADAVSAGNENLAALAKAEGVDAAVLPTVVVVGEGPPAPEPSTLPPTIGWIGSRSTLPYLQRATIPLAALIASGHAIRLRVIADAMPILPPGIPVEQVPWSTEGEASALDGIHIGIAPLPDDPWTRGKCGLKVLQTLSHGRPVVASPVGVQAKQIRDGVTGFLARDEEAFVARLAQLLHDADLRHRMGVAAREDVRARWSVAAWQDRVAAHVARTLA